MRPPNLLFVLCLFMVSACTEAPLESYEPVVDRFFVDRMQYSRDITECRSVAVGAMAQAKQRRDAQMAPNILTGLLIGATIGNASGIGYTRKDSTKQGAVFGALAGAAESGEDVKLGPRRIMDRCMANRGYDLLNDTP
jgi:uncharacterized protein YcfJ